MHPIITWLMGLVNRWLDWVFRKRNVGLGITVACCSVLAAIVSGNVTVEANGVLGVVDTFKFSTGGGEAGLVQSAIAWVMLVGAIIGIGMTVHAYRKEAKEADAKRVVVVELRGLVDTSDHPLIKAVPKSINGLKVDALVDVRQLLTGVTPNVPAALQELAHIQRHLRQVRGDTARADVQVVAGGIMPVPLLFYTGVLLDDEGHAVLMDWERTAKVWKPLADTDDGTRFLISGAGSASSAREVVLAVSASYMVEMKDVKATFPELPLVHMERQGLTVNSSWSEENQRELTQQFLQMLGALANQGVELVHLILAAPASLSIRFGMAYDVRNMPNLRCYQWNRNQIPPYEWSVEMPTSHHAPASFIRTPVRQAIPDQERRTP